MDHTRCFGCSLSSSIKPSLQTYLTTAANVDWLDADTCHLEIPASPQNEKSSYCVAQLDDYHHLKRCAFPWQPLVKLTLRARVSDENLPGTWGFGFWNDPFSLSLGLEGASRRFPALPNTAWFFYASPPNYLSFRDDLPAQGFLAATFRSPAIPALLLAPASPLLGLSIWSPTGRLLRCWLRRLIQQDATLVTAMHPVVNDAVHPINIREWHQYSIAWRSERVTFSVDKQDIFVTSISPYGPLALVLWIDNQYAAFPSTGRLSFGSLPVFQPAWLELSDLRIEE